MTRALSVASTPQSSQACDDGWTKDKMADIEKEVELASERSNGRLEEP
jgi:hypothetical protein